MTPTVTTTTAESCERGEKTASGAGLLGASSTRFINETRRRYRCTAAWSAVGFRLSEFRLTKPGRRPFLGSVFSLEFPTLYINLHVCGVCWYG